MAGLGTLKALQNLTSALLSYSQNPRWGTLVSYSIWSQCAALAWLMQEAVEHDQRI